MLKNLDTSLPKTEDKTSIKEPFLAQAPMIMKMQFSNMAAKKIPNMDSDPGLKTHPHSRYQVQDNTMAKLVFTQELEELWADK